MPSTLTLLDAEGVLPHKLDVETTLKIVLPPEVSALIKDVHHSQTFIGAGFAVFLICYAALTFKRLSGPTKP